MKGFVEVTPEKDPYLPGPLLKDTGGKVYRKKRKNMSKNVISVRDSCQTFPSLEEFLILFPTLGLLLNGVWIL